MPFKIAKKLQPKGDQPKAIEKLVAGIRRGDKKQTLLGVTGSGKTFTMANVIQNINRPALVIAHNKTLAAQLASEFKEYFPNNAVEYFVSYYDYYQPEAYLPDSDIYIEKEATINDEIDRLRHKATQALLTREDVIIVASVSAIYSLGSPQEYKDALLQIAIGQKISREQIMRQLINLQYDRTTSDLTRGSFRARGEVIEILPSAQNDNLIRVILTGNRIGKIEIIHAITRKTLSSENSVWIFPARHYVVPKEEMAKSLKAIEIEMENQIAHFQKQNKLLEADRIERRTKYDLEMIREIGYCNGIENYSRYFDGRSSGEPPYTLLNYFPKDYLLFIDESHVTVPQIGGMFEGDRARKETLVEHGFRLPSARDNRPLKIDEFWQRINQAIFVSATPARYESENSSQIVEQIIRPTGLVDPEVDVRPISGQIDDLIGEINNRIAKRQRTLVTTLTKKMAEDLSAYLKEANCKVDYIHSDIETLNRLKILRNLRQGKTDVVVGVNLLREGLDLPEVSLVAILDADKEGFLHSETSLIQTIGRAARNVEGKVILYADNITGSMRRAISETNRRRSMQLKFNKQNNITPKTIEKNISSILDEIEEAAAADVVEKVLAKKDLPALIAQKERLMKQAAAALRFEEAAAIRDELVRLKSLTTRITRI